MHSSTLGAGVVNVGAGVGPGVPGPATGLADVGVTATGPSVVGNAVAWTVGSGWGGSTGASVLGVTVGALIGALVVPSDASPVEAAEAAAEPLPVGAAEEAAGDGEGGGGGGVGRGTGVDTTSFSGDAVEGEAVSVTRVIGEEYEFSSVTNNSELGATVLAAAGIKVPVPFGAGTDAGPAVSSIAGVAPTGAIDSVLPVGSVVIESTGALVGSAATGGVVGLTALVGDIVGLDTGG